MTEFSTETAARARVPTWPAKTWVMAPREYLHMEVKMAGPARYHSFFNSMRKCLEKSPGPLIGGMSAAPGTKVAAEEVFTATGAYCSWSCSSLWFPLEDRSGCSPSSSITEKQRDRGCVCEQCVYLAFECFKIFYQNQFKHSYF
jgi:hypothetical protein